MTYPNKTWIAGAFLAFQGHAKASPGQGMFLAADTLEGLQRVLESVQNPEMPEDAPSSVSRWRKLNTHALLGAEYALRVLHSSPRIRGAALELLKELHAEIIEETKARATL